jgi:hypothetical protein
MRLTVTSLLGERKPDDVVLSRGSEAMPPAYPCEKPGCATQLDAPEESYLARRKAARRERQELAETGSSVGRHEAGTPPRRGSSDVGRGTVALSHHPI